MVFALSTEQIDLQTNLRRFLQNEADLAYVRKRFEGSEISDPVLKKKISELGFVEYFASDDSTMRGSIRDLVIIAEECGRFLVSENLLEDLAVGAYFFQSILAAPLRSLVEARGGKGLLGDIYSGKLSVIYAPAANEVLGSLQITAIDSNEFCSGELRMVRGEGDLVLYHSGGVLRCIFLNSAHGQVKRSAEGSLDRTLKSQKISLSNVPLVSLPSECAETLKLLVGLAHSAELLGVAERALELTIEYVKTRKQFEVPIGSFQAVQHRLAEMKCSTEALRSLIQFAAWAFDADTSQRDLAIISALEWARRNVPEIVHGAIQLHGGTGFTWEHDLHLYLRRAQQLSALYQVDDTQRNDRILNLASVSQSA